MTTTPSVRKSVSHQNQNVFWPQLLLKRLDGLSWNFQEIFLKVSSCASDKKLICTAALQPPPLVLRISCMFWIKCLHQAVSTFILSPTVVIKSETTWDKIKKPRKSMICYVVVENVHFGQIYITWMCVTSSTLLTCHSRKKVPTPSILITHTAWLKEHCP